MATTKAPTYGKDLPGNLGTDAVIRAIYDKIETSSSSSSEKVAEKLDDISLQLGSVNERIDNVNNVLCEHSKALENINETIKDISTNVLVYNKIKIDTKKLPSKEEVKEIANNISDLKLAIKDISINVLVNNKIEIDTDNLPTREDIKGISESIDNLALSNTKDFDNISDVIKLQTKGLTSIKNVLESGFVANTDAINSLNNLIKESFSANTKAIETLKPKPEPYPYPYPEPDINFYPVYIGLPPSSRPLYTKKRECKKPVEKKYECKTILSEEQRVHYETLNPNLDPWKIAYYNQLRKSKERIRYPAHN